MKLQYIYCDVVKHVLHARSPIKGVGYADRFEAYLLAAGIILILYLIFQLCLTNFSFEHLLNFL